VCVHFATQLALGSMTVIILPDAQNFTHHSTKRGQRNRDKRTGYAYRHYTPSRLLNVCCLLVVAALLQPIEPCETFGTLGPCRKAALFQHLSMTPRCNLPAEIAGGELVQV
jgi:hypothetical protein